MEHTIASEGQGRAVARGLYLPELGTADEISWHLQVSPATVRRMLRDGTLVGSKVGRRWYVSRRALLGLVEGRRLPSSPLYRIWASRSDKEVPGPGEAEEES